MGTFIKVVEIWAKTPDGTGIALVHGLYGQFDELKQASQNCVFQLNEGLPGKAWATATPQIITNLKDSNFKRIDVASRAGLNSGIAIPIFVGEFLSAVVVLLCGEKSQSRENLTGAIELWANQKGQADVLNLCEAYYGSLCKLEDASRNIQFPKGSGLPGSVWDYRIPMLVSNMLDSSLFKRASTAAIEGITSAIGLPLSYYTGKDYVLTFLSAHKTPIAMRFEIWVPDRETECLFFHTGVCEKVPNLKTLYRNARIPRGEGLLGQVWLTGFPAISEDPKRDNHVHKESARDLSSSLSLPIIEDGYLKSIVVFMF